MSRCPSEDLDRVGVFAGHRFQVQVLLEFFENKLYLPSQPVQLAQCLGAPLGNGKAREVRPLLSAGARDNHQSRIDPTVLSGIGVLSPGNQSDVEIPAASNACAFRQQVAQMDALGRSPKGLAYAAGSVVDPKHDRIAIESHGAKKVVTGADEFLNALVGSKAFVEQKERAAPKEGPGREQSHVLRIAGDQESVEGQQAVHGDGEHDFERGFHVTRSLVERPERVSELNRRAVPGDDVWEAAG
jgi:hypothetical protein